MKSLRRIMFVVSVALAGSVATRAAETTPAQEVKALLLEFMDAAGRNDRAVFDKFFADDVIYTRSTGAVITKADIMASLEKAPATTDEKTTYSAEDITVHIYDATAVVAFRLAGRTERKNGTTETTYYRNTGTFVKRDGRWQVVAWQATKIAERAKPK